MNIYLACEVPQTKTLAFHRTVLFGHEQIMMQPIQITYRFKFLWRSLGWHGWSPTATTTSSSSPTTRGPRQAAKVDFQLTGDVIGRAAENHILFIQAIMMFLEQVQQL